MIHRIGTIRSNLHLKHSVGTRPADPLDSNSDASQILSQPPVIDGNVNKLPHPLWRNLHFLTKTFAAKAQRWRPAGRTSKTLRHPEARSLRKRTYAPTANYGHRGTSGCASREAPVAH